MPFCRGTVSTAGTAGASTLFFGASSPLVELQAGNKAIRPMPAIRVKGVLTITGRPFALCIKFLSCIFAVFYVILQNYYLLYCFLLGILFVKPAFVIGWVK